MKNDPYFINTKQRSESMKGSQIGPLNEIRRIQINWGAPYLDGCKNCAQQCNDPAIDKYDDETGTYYRCEDFEYMGVWLQRQARELINEFITTNDNRYIQKTCTSCDQKQTCKLDHKAISNCQQSDILEEIQHECETCNIQDCREC